MSGLKETNSSQGARKTTRVFRNSRTKEEAAMGRKLVNSACLQVPRSDATFLVHAKDEDNDLRQIEEKNQKRTVERELPADVLNINIAEGLYEYCQDVHSYLRQMEEVLSISPDYLDKDQVTGHMRSVLVNWLTEVQHHLKVSVETLYRTVHTLDLVLSLRSVEPNMLQLVGITCMLLASKLEEYYPVEISKLLHLTEDSYKPKEVVNMERIILKLIDFKFITPSPQAFLPMFTRAALRSAETEFYSSCTYLLDCHLVVMTHSCLPPSHLAAAAVLAALTLYKAAVKDCTASPALSTIWTPTLVYYTSYKAGDILLTALELLNQLESQASVGSKFNGANIKYRSSSQHNRLALADHLKVETVQKAMEILKPTGDKN